MTYRIVPAYVLSFAALLIASSCSTPAKVRVDRDASTNFANYKTFAWFAIPEETKEAAPAPAPDAKPPAKGEARPRPVDSMVGNRVRGAIQSSLQSKGYSLTESTPDFRVSYALNVYDRPKKSGMSIGLGAGGGSGNASGGVGVSVPLGSRTETVATLTVDVIDAARNSQVWTGSFEKRVKETVTEEDAQELVNTILSKFPIDAAAK